MSRSPVWSITVRVVVPFALGYFLSYFYRVINALIAPELTTELDLDATALGFLTSAYFFTFAAFQLPLGVLLDRFGPRRTESALLVAAAIGAVVFATSESVTALVVGRALIGLGVSACLMAAFKAYVLWFPAERRPLVNGVHMAIGGLGALVATRPVEIALRFTDWRGVFLVLAAVTVAVAAIQFFLVPEREGARSKDTLAEQLAGVAHIFRSREFRAIAPWATTSQGSGLAIHTLWVGPWLRDVGGLDGTAVANYLAFIVLALIAGFMLFGALTTRLSRAGVRPMSVAIAGMSLFMLVQVTLVTGTTECPLMLWMVFTFVSGTGILCYPALSQEFPSALSGRVTTGLNLLVFLWAFAAQWGIGAIINQWPDGEGSYEEMGYRVAFGAVLVTQIASAAWWWLSKRDRRTPQP
ncbi:MAG: MFS transporter [Gammaproteobacteria bacterium]|nr:MFS transporter [Gammaproteobacteria bacterium]MDH3465369.1 MFS transporter [Gammaproteobacteria bacterium]